MSFYSENEIQKLLNSYEVDTFKRKEQYLLLSLIAMLGLRVSDAVYLKLFKINFEEKAIIID